MSQETPEIFAISATDNWIHLYEDVASLLSHTPQVIADCERGETDLFDTAGFALKPNSGARSMTLDRVGDPDPELVAGRLRAVIENRGLSGQLLSAPMTVKPHRDPAGGTDPLLPDGLRAILLGDDGQPSPIGSSPGNADTAAQSPWPAHGPDPMNRGSTLHMLLCHPFG